MLLRPQQNNPLTDQHWLLGQRWWWVVHNWLVGVGVFLERARAASKLRRKRQRLLYKAIRSRRQLSTLREPKVRFDPNDVLLFCVARNEIDRLPHFLTHYRTMGVQHFFFVDNASDDGTVEYLSEQPDVSIWRTDASYKASRFGVDWLNWLLFRYGHGHWCVTADVDEILVFPHSDTRPIDALTSWLDRTGAEAFGAMMLDMYPKSNLGLVRDDPDRPFDTLTWFDAGNYIVRKQEPMDNLWIQGGPRARAFFSETPVKSPTLNKTPLVKWNRRYVYVNSTHSALPRRLNHIYCTNGGEKPSGVLLHTKFLHTILDKSNEELDRKQHFQQSEDYTDYHKSLTQGPNLWVPSSQKFRNWQQLEELGLMSSGGWV